MTVKSEGKFNSRWQYLRSRIFTFLEDATETPEEKMMAIYAIAAIFPQHGVISKEQALQLLDASITGEDTFQIINQL